MSPLLLCSGDSVRQNFITMFQFLTALGTFITLSCWILDLTTQGVEPNPGPKNKRNRKPQVVKEVVIEAQPKKQGKRKNHKQQQHKGKGMLSNVLNAAGSMVSPAAGKVGGALGSIISKVTGLGAYHVAKNELMMGNSPPAFGSGSGDVVLTHREFISNVTGQSAFTIRNYVLNPGDSVTFPWLSTIAAGYQEYEFLGVIFEFKTTSGTAISGVNPALGTAVAATQYDVYASPFLDKATMEQYQYSTSCCINQSMLHPVECKPRENLMRNLLIRDSNPAVDGHWYDLGIFSLATVGLPDSSPDVIGELWVSYKIRLLRPKVSPSGPTQLAAWHWYSTVSSGQSAAAPFSFLLFDTGSSPLPPTMQLQNTELQNIPLGNYLILYTSDVNASSTGMDILAMTSGGTNVNRVGEGGGHNNQSFFDACIAGGPRGMSASFVNVTSTTNTFGVFTSGNFAAGAVVSTDLWVIRMPAGVTNYRNLPPQLRIMDKIAELSARVDTLMSENLRLSS